MRRKRMGRRSSRKVFKRTAGQHGKNAMRPIMRGGIRL